MRPRSAAIGILAICGVFWARVGILWISAKYGYALNGYADEAVCWFCLLASLGLAVLALIQLVAHAAQHRWRAALGSAASCGVSLAVACFVSISFGYLKTKLPLASVESKYRHTRYILCNALIPTDVCYEIAGVPERGGQFLPFWKIAFDTGILDYSEDGSLTSHPKLLLSNDESLLVIERGGQYTDAIDLDLKTNLVSDVYWSAANRESLWVARTGKIHELLAARVRTSQ